MYYISIYFTLIAGKTRRNRNPKTRNFFTFHLMNFLNILDIKIIKVVINHSVDYFLSFK